MLKWALGWISVSKRKILGRNAERNWPYNDNTSICPDASASQGGAGLYPTPRGRPGVDFPVLPRDANPAHTSVRFLVSRTWRGESLMAFRPEHLILSPSPPGGVLNTTEIPPTDRPAARGSVALSLGASSLTAQGRLHFLGTRGASTMQ